MATFTSLLPRILYDLGEPIPVTFQPEELFEYAKEGARIVYDIVRTYRPDLLATSVNHSLVSGDSSFTAPSSCVVILSILAVLLDSEGNDSAVIELNKREIEWVRRYQIYTTFPKYWTRVGTTIHIAPKLNDNYRIEVYYVPSYTPPTSFDAVLLPTQIPTLVDKYISEYVIIRAKNRNDTPTLLEQQFLNLFSETIRSAVISEEPIRQMRGTTFDSYYANLGF